MCENEETINIAHVHKSSIDMCLKVIPAFCPASVHCSYAYYCPLPLVEYRCGSGEICYLADKMIFLVKFQKGTKDSNLRARSSASQEYSLF